MADPVSATMAVIHVVEGAAAAYKAWAGAHIILATIAELAVSTAASAVLNKLTAPKSKLNSSGSQSSFSADTTAGIPFVLGRTGIGGDIVFKYPFGPNNKHLVFWAVLSAASTPTGVQAVESFAADKNPVTFDGNGAVNNGAKYASRMWMTQQLGLANSPVIPQPALPATDSSWAGIWTSQHRLSGYALAAWDLEYDSKVYSSGEPAPIWVVRGVKCYDPRKDSTYAGGSGAHRLNDRTTWDYTENPYLHGLTYCLGYVQNGKRIGGAGISVDMIDVAAFVEGANVADANNWKVGGRITSTDSKWQCLQAILQAGSGEPLKVGGKVSCRINAPRTSLATLTANDLAGPVNIMAVKSRRDRKNSIVPRYRSEDDNWIYVSGSAVTSSTYQTQDGGLRQQETEYTLVQNVTQAGQLAAYDLVNAREFGPITIEAKPKWMGFKPGDCITLDIPEMGLNAQKAIITARDLDLATGKVNLTLESETDGKHAFALGQTTTPPLTPGLSQPDFSTVPAPASGQWTATATTQSGGGASVPCITITGNASDYAFAQDIVVEYRKHGDADWIASSTTPVSSGAVTIAGLGGSTAYDVAISYKSIYGVTGPRTVLGPVTTTAGYGVASSILNQGGLATANNVKFNDGTIQESGGATATDLNYKTPLGTAAAITGQGAFATLSNVAYGSPYLSGFGQMAGFNWVQTGISGTSGDRIGLYSATYNWLSDTLIITQIGTASGIVGQGAFATQSSVALGSSFLTGFGGLAGASSVNMADGTVINKTAQYISYTSGGSVDSLKPAQAGADVTGSNTAAAIAGQSAWATFGATTNRVSRLQDDGFAEAGLIYRSGVGQLTDFWPATTGADKTGNATAAAFNGQGAFATLSQISLNTNYLKLADGTTSVTESIVVTSIGVASAINGQGSLATQSSINPGQVVDPSQPSIPLRAVATVGKRNPDYNDMNFYYSDSGYPRFVKVASFYNNDASKPINQRVRTGTVSFEMIAHASVDIRMSIWYEVHDSSGALVYAPSAINWLDNGLDSASGYGDATACMITDINISPGYSVHFYMSINNADLTSSTGERHMNESAAVVKAINL